MAEKVLWLSPIKWKYPPKYESSDLPTPEFHYFNISKIKSDWNALLSCPEDWSHVVIVMTEPLLLLMNDPENKKAIYDLLNILVTQNIKHSIIMLSGSFQENIEIFQEEYYPKYIYYKLYNIHRDAFFRAINNADFWNANELIYSDFITDYLVILVSQLHDQQYFEYASRIAEGAGPFFDDQEKALIRFPSSQLIIVDEDIAQKEIIVPGLTVEYNRRRGVWERRFPSAGTVKRNIDALFDWQEIEAYLSVYGTNRTSFQSKKMLEKTLDDKVFQSLLHCLNLDISDSDKEEYQNVVIQNIRELKSWNGLNIISVDGKEDMLSYLNDYVGPSRFIVFSKYVLHDSIQADAIDKLMILFEKYVVVYQKQDLKFNRTRTSQGTFYVVKDYNPSSNKMNYSVLEKQFSDLWDEIDDPLVDIDTIAKNYHFPLRKARSIIQSFQTEKLRLNKDITKLYLTSINESYKPQKKAKNGSQETDQKPVIDKLDLVPQLNQVQLDNPIIASLIRGVPSNKILQEIDRIIEQYEDPAKKVALHDAVNIASDPELDLESRKANGQKARRGLNNLKQYLGDYEKSVIDEWFKSLDFR